LLDRETVLAGGVPAKRANTLLFLIESRTAHLMVRSRQAMELFPTQESAKQRDLAFLEAFALGSEPPLRPTIRDLERYAPQWASLVPENPLGARRGRQLPQQILQALGEESGSPAGAEPSRASYTASISESFRELLSSKYGSFLAGASPLAAAFLVAEWLVLTGSVSFARLLSILGVIVIPLLGGIFPVLLLVAGRRKGERVPGAVYGFLDNPLLLVGIYVLFPVKHFSSWSGDLGRPAAAR